MNPIILEENNSTAFEKSLKTDLDQAIEHFKKELATIRSGRAHTSMVENIKVVCYGGTSELRLKEVAALAAPDSNMIVIEPWDKSIIPDIERALSTSDLGLTPANDGNIIRLQLPAMSAQRREELVKILSKKLEDSRVAIRSIRKDFHNLIREKERDKKISQDFSKRITEKLQKTIDSITQNLDDMAKKKENDIKSV